MTTGLLVDGVIESIDLHVVPSKFAGQAGRAVTRIVLKIERALSPNGDQADRRLFTSAFQGPAELASEWHVGEAVRIETTTPTGLHIATIGATDIPSPEDSADN